MIKLHKLTQRLILYLILLIIGFFYNQGLVVALSESYYTIHAPLYNPTVECSEEEDSSGAIDISKEKIYFVGDSIIDGGEGAIRSRLTNAGVENANIKINGEISRSITGDGQQGTSGLDAIREDRNTIKESGIAVIVLGTNGGNTEKNIKRMVTDIKDLNKDIKIYWVNIGVSRSDLTQTMENGNKALDQSSKDLGYEVVDWYKEIKGSDPSGLLSDQVHPNEKGYKIFSSLIYSSIKDGIADADESSNSASGVEGDKSNAAKIWAYLVSEEGLGLTAVQAAGALGNMQQENSLFHPKVTQGGGRSNEVIVNGSTGYGIVQWTTAGRQQGLKDHAEKIGKSSGTLDAQLSYIKHELNNGYKGTLERLRKVKDDPVEAAFVWHGAGNFSIPGVTPSPGYESSGDSESTVRNVRGGNAKKWLNKYGDKTSSYTESEACASSDNDNDGVIGSKDYTDNPRSISKGEQVAEQARDWAKNDPRCSWRSDGCYQRCLGIVSNLWTSVGKGVVSGNVPNKDWAWYAYKRYKDNGWVNKNKSVPVGAIMWSADLDNTGYGHVYTYLGDGLIASNDIVEKGKYSIVPAADIEKKWGHTFLGWSEWHP
jgi:lysophospholipase L1-like esterase